MSSKERGTTDEPADSCYFCGGGQGVIEKHHIVPRRHGGSDKDENLVGLCPTCHERLERLYNKRFYDRLGIRKGSDDPNTELLKALRIVADSYSINHDTTIEYKGDVIENLISEFNLEGRFCRACQKPTFMIPPREDFDEHYKFDSCCVRCHSHVEGIAPHGTREEPPEWFEP